jgi:CheY-like chemotaxis protein
VKVGVALDGWSPDAHSLADAPSVVALSVTDTGIGIENEHQRRIFEEFSQGDGSTARRYGGTGLGLSISRELVGLIGGQLTVASTPGVGSTFTVYLPAGQPSIGSPPAASTSASKIMPAASGATRTQLLVPPSDRGRLDSIATDGFAGLKVLVVDDDFRNAFALTALFERVQSQVTVAESGELALLALNEPTDFDIVLMDIMMPVMDGYETMRAIRALNRFTSLPIIAVTGKVIPGERERCLDAGANDYVPKPVDTADLFDAIGPWLPVPAPVA